MDPTNPQGQPSSPSPEPEHPARSPVLAAQFPSPNAGQAPASGIPGKLPSAFSLFAPSQRAVSHNLLAFCGLILAPSLLADIWNTAFMSNHFRTQHVAPLGVFGVLFFLYEICVIAALPYIQLKSARGEKVGFMQAINGGRPYFWRLIGLYIIMTAIIVIGLVLFIVPGIIMIRRYFLANYFLVDRNLGIQEAMRQSAAATKGRSGAVWGIIGVQILLAGVSIVPILGRFISTVIALFYSVAPAMRYEQLKDLDNQANPSAQPPLS